MPRPTAALLLVIVTILTPASAIACDKRTRITTFLGWTADSRLFAWRVHQTCEGCKPKWVDERTFVRATSGHVTEYLTRYEQVIYPRPELPDGKAFAAWLQKNPLVKTPPKNEQASLTVTQGGSSLTAKRNGEFCAKKEGPVELLSSRGARTWQASSAACGCARGFASPDGSFVVWITGPEKRTCDDCHGNGCCGDVESVLVSQER
jgi:hypothetical protein